MTPTPVSAEVLMPILDIAALHKSYGSSPVLKGIDLKVGQNELVFIIGPSGSGKSTLLRCCNRLEEPDSGSIMVDGTDIMRAGVDLNRLRQKIGMVFQSFNLYPHMTALGNVTLALRKVQKLGREEADRKGMAALDRVGLSDKYLAYPNELSGGQQQRVGIARALAPRALDRAVRRADQRARSGTGRRRAERDARAEGDRHDHGGREP